jgi:hypothetical protein
VLGSHGSGSRLLLHSVNALDTQRMAALEALGTPTWMFVPNG